MTSKKILIIFQSLLLGIFVPLLIIFGWALGFHSSLPYTNGRHFDEESNVVWNEDAKLVYGLISLLLLIVVVLLTKWLVKTIKSR